MRIGVLLVFIKWDAEVNYGSRAPASEASSRQAKEHLQKVAKYINMIIVIDSLLYVTERIESDNCCDLINATLNIETNN